MTKFKVKLRRRDIPDIDLLDDLKRVAEEFKTDSITKPMYEEKGQFGVTTMLRRFGGWNKALESAGLKIQFNTKISNEDLFENLAEVWQHLGRQPFGRDMEKSENVSKYSLGTYEHRFKTWNNALLEFINYINGSELTNSTSLDSSKREAKTKIKRTPRNVNWRLRAQVLIRDNCICKMCGASPSKDASVVLHVDHIVPYSKDGETVLENLQTLCHVCNIGKSDQ